MMLTRQDTVNRHAMTSMTRSEACRRRAMAATIGGLATTLAAMLAGCGPRPPALAKVSGTVTLDGEPLARGTLTFEATGRRPATARILDGRIIEVTTHRSNDGVPVGHQRIAVFSREEPASGPAHQSQRHGPPATAGFPASMAGRSLLPARYNDSATSGLSATIRPGHNELSLTLTHGPSTGHDPQ